jgi:hypothetical protein
MQVDGLQGFACHKTGTATFIRDAAWYAWKLGTAASRGYNGMWSDNLVPGFLKGAGWFYGSGHAVCSGSAAEWDAGLVTICQGLRDRGVPLVGGNVVYRATNSALKTATNIAELETLVDVISGGADSFAYEVSQTSAWFAVGPQPKYLLVVHTVPQTNTAEMKFGLALTCILGGSYFPRQSDSDLYQPAEMLPRGRFGVPTGPAVRNGNVFTRTFTAGTVTANFTAHTASFPN